MIAVLQRVVSASVVADGTPAGSIGRGLYVLLGVEREDTERDAELLAEKLHKLRIFTDDAGKMNLSSDDIGAELLVVSNFTLCAHYAHGNRPDYLDAAPPAVSEPLYEHFLSLCRSHYGRVECGVFGADMQTNMITDGPVTICMNSKILDKKRSRNEHP